MKKLFFTLAILAGFVMQALAYDFQSEGLSYTIISTEPPCVRLDGHVDSFPIGELNIPETVTWQGIVYSVTMIKDQAFEANSGLTGNLVIPNTVTEIGYRAFGGCDHFTGDLVIPNSVRAIGMEAFSDCSGFDGSLVLPDSLEVIEFWVFSGCSGLTGTLNIPNTVTEIKTGAFNGCSGFTGDLVIPNSVKHLGLTDSYTTRGVFCDCEGFDGHLVLPDSLEDIGAYCFASCSNLIGELVIPYTVREIQRNAFDGCSGLTGSLTLPDGLTYIGLGAFSGCSGLSGELVIPNSVVEIQPYAFSSMSHLTSVSIPNSVTSIGNGAFQLCPSLVSINVPEGITEIPENMLDHCSKLTEVVLPDGITAIRSTAFSHCEKLASVNIPRSCDTIGASAFANCRNLTSVDFPDGLLSIGMDAFFGCDRIKRLVIPNSVVDIAQMAFVACDSLSYLVIGASVEHIGVEAFWSDMALDTIVSLAVMPPTLDADAFPPLAYQTVSQLIVPCGFLDDYLTSGWTTYFSEDTFVEDCGFDGAEWYYEIQNENGSITYQHLEYAADTTINHKDVVVIIRTNTLYDKAEHSEVTREYIYEEDGIVYWWNPQLQDFTVLYDFGAEEGDEWEITVGTESITMHVDAVEHYEFDGRLFKLLQVSDPENLFSGTIVCGIGHLTSFFPERLMTRGEKYRVEGMRCYWREGELFFKYGDRDCDEVYKEWHNGIEEDGPSTPSTGSGTAGTFTVYPNPTDGVLFVETRRATSLPAETYRITNLMGQTVHTGSLNAETQQIDVSDLPQGMYFITVGGATQKFVVR